MPRHVATGYTYSAAGATVDLVHRPLTWPVNRALLLRRRPDGVRLRADETSKPKSRGCARCSVFKDRLHLADGIRRPLMLEAGSCRPPRGPRNIAASPAWHNPRTQLSCAGLVPCSGEASSPAYSSVGARVEDRPDGAARPVRASRTYRGRPTKVPRRLRRRESGGTGACPPATRGRRGRLRRRRGRSPPPRRASLRPG